MILEIPDGRNCKGCMFLERDLDYICKSYRCNLFDCELDFSYANGVPYGEHPIKCYRCPQ